MITIEKMTDLVRRAEGGELDCIHEARQVLADTLLAGTPVDETALEQLAIRAGGNVRNVKVDALVGNKDTTTWFLHWGNLLTACSDYIRHKQVGLPGGVCATTDGLNYENCEPEDLNARISRQVSERLEAYIATLTDAHASYDPERNPSEYDEKYDEFVERAIIEYLNKQGFPQLWQTKEEGQNAQTSETR
jgi:hypothetical protein